MNSRKHTTYAFTLIELLTVITVIVILSSILIPVTGSVIRQSRVAASKAQLWQYITAIEQFKAEYNYYPTVYDNNGLIDLSSTGVCEDFLEAISGKNHSNAASYGDPIANGGNYRMIEYHSFSEKEFLENNDGSISPNELADRFNNDLVFILLDIDGDGRIFPNITGAPDPGWIRASGTAWVNEGEGPAYALWE